MKLGWKDSYPRKSMAYEYRKVVQIRKSKGKFSSCHEEVFRNDKKHFVNYFRYHYKNVKYFQNTGGWKQWNEGPYRRSSYIPLLLRNVDYFKYSDKLTQSLLQESNMHFRLHLLNFTFTDLPRIFKKT